MAQGCIYYLDTKQSYFGEISDNLTYGIENIKINVRDFIDDHPVIVTVSVSALVVGSSIAIVALFPESVAALTIQRIGVAIFRTSGTIIRWMKNLNKVDPTFIKKLDEMSSLKNVFKADDKFLKGVILFVLSGLFHKAEGAECKPHDPLIFDLNNDGVLETTDINNGVYFDHENDGFAEASAWVGKNDGILVIDTNSNNEIDNGTELVTAETIASFDSNNDGIIDINDTDFENLKILKGDGTLLTLEEAGIQSINLSTTQINEIDENGNEQVYEATYTRTDGTTGKYGEFLVNTDTSEAIATEWLDETDEIAELPDIAGSGTIYSLHQSILRDESGELQELVEDFVSETNESVRQSLVDQILAKWAEVGAIDPSSRGVYVNAQHLAVLEAFMGRIFASYAEPKKDGNCSECGDHCYCNEPNMPNPNQGMMLETAYQQLRNNVYAELMSQTHNSNLLDDIEIDFDINTMQFTFNLDAVTAKLQQAIAENEQAGKAKAVQFVTTLKGLGLEPYSNYFDPFDDNCLYTALTKNDRELKWQFDTIGKIPFIDEIGDGEGSMGDDSYRAEEDSEYSHFHAYAGDDVMYGDNGTDHFAACDGDDILDGGDGDDILDSHNGDDTIFGGAGNDILVGGKDEDTLYGGSGKDLLIAGETTKTQEELQNIINNNGAISVTDFESDNSQNTMYGGIGNDIIIGDKGSDTIYGGGDNDTIYGGKGNDTIYGDDKNNIYEGDDVIYGGDGNDTIYGGKGDDILIAGSSTITPEAIRTLAKNNNLIVDNFMSFEKTENKLYGGEGKDIIIGDSGDDVIYGNDNNDIIYGGKGDDILDGGSDAD